jgi:hypothetical protein
MFHRIPAKLSKEWNGEVRILQPFFEYILVLLRIKGARGSLVVKALGYKPEGFETRWVEILNLPNPSRRTRPWGLLSL